MRQLQERIGRHPAYKDRFGRDLADGDSENELSDNAMERLTAHDQLERDETIRQIAQRLDSETGSRSDRRIRPKRTRSRTNAQNSNAGKSEAERQAPVAQPQAKGRKRLRSPNAGSDADREQPDTSIVVEPAHPAAGVSSKRSTKRSPSPTALKKRQPSQASATGDTITPLVLSSDSGDELRQTKRKTRQPAKATSPIAPPANAITVRSGKGSKVRSKPRMSMEKAIEAAQKIKIDELKTHFVDISAFIDHLAAFEPDRPGTLLAGCRIAFVNADHWKSRGGAGSSRNRFDQGLRLEMGIVAKQGGELIKPDAFIAPPADLSLASMTQRDIDDRAEKEGWTTHIIGFHPSSYRPPTFREIVKCLGGGDGISIDELGSYVKVVKFAWVSQCVKDRKRQSEWEFAIDGDPRVTPPSRVNSTKSSPVKKTPQSSPRKSRQTRQAGPAEGYTTEESDGDNFEHEAVSPFGSQDYPIGENPADREDQIEPPGQASELVQIEKTSTVPKTLPLHEGIALEGLEEQSELVRSLGTELVDDILDHEQGYFIYEGVEDDCETENEVDVEGRDKHGGAAARVEQKKPARRGRYVVDREFVAPGTRVGPNDATADVLLKLAELHKGDTFREKGYRVASSALRRQRERVSDYQKLRKIKGIGESIAQKIIEIDRTGSHRKLSHQLPEDRAAQLFAGVYGIGLVLGRRFAQQGARSIEDLKREEFFTTLTLDQQVGLEYYDDLRERIPRAEVTALYDTVLRAARQVDPELQVECMGSYKRGQADSGDIDILITRDPTEDRKTHSGSIGKIYNILKSEGFFQHILAASEDWSDLACKVNGLCRLPGGKMRRIDILGVPWADMPAALIYFTGNDHFNRSLRLKARHMGYSLNQKCLSKLILRDKSGNKLTEGTRIHVTSEREIFDILQAQAAPIPRRTQGRLDITGSSSAWASSGDLRPMPASRPQAIDLVPPQPGDSRSPLPSPASRRSLLGHLKRIPRPPRPRVPFRGNAQQRRTELFKPLNESDSPLGTLVIQVLAARDLVAKDRNGLSDPYVVIRYGNHRVTSPTAYKTLHPTWSSQHELKHGEDVAGEAKLQIPAVYESLGLARERVEIVCWDRDRVGSEYMGEVSLSVEDWGDISNVEDLSVGFSDERNKPRWHALRSSRSRATVSGEILVKIGFVPLNGNPNSPLHETDRHRIVSAFKRIAERAESARRGSREDRLLLTSPVEGYGTIRADEQQPLGGSNLPYDLESESDSDATDATIDDDDDTASDIETDDEGVLASQSALAEASSDEDEDDDSGETEAKDYFDLDRSNHLPVADSPLPAIVVGGVTEEKETSSPVPIATSSAHQPVEAGAPTTAPPHRRGLSLPQFIRRRTSTASVPSISAGTAVDSLAASDVETPVSTPGRQRRRFSRKSRSSKSTLDGVTSGLTPTDTSPSGDSQVHSQAKGKKRERAKRKTRRNKQGREYTFDDGDDIAGLVQIEVKSAKGLPRWKNALRTGYDMDGFVVCSFGRKIFRTRVIRHSLNPVWEERLFFHVRPAETHWNINFSVLDWDKFTGNDHVGDVTVELDKLLGKTVQPDERGVFAAGADGRLVGDDFHEHDLELVTPDNTESAKPILTIRAKYTPFSALRQQFWRIYSSQYDVNESGSFSQIEIFSLLDSLGSTLAPETVESFFTRYDKRWEEDELTTEELVLCLEEELRKHNANKSAHESLETGANTPGFAGIPGAPGTLQGGSSAGSFVSSENVEEPGQYDQTDLSSDMKTIAPGTEVVTDAEKGTTVKAPEPHGSVKPPVRQSSFEPWSDDAVSGSGNVERVINIKSCPLCNKPRMSKKGELDIITHLGICSSTDPGSANRFLVSDFVTASQAQRKFFSKVVSKITKGSYRLGADSANIIVQDRHTGALLEEKIAVYVRLGIRLMYRGMGTSATESARVRRLLDSLTKKQGLKYDSPASKRDIAPFIAFHNLNLDEILDPLPSYQTFNQFFYRKLKPEARPLDDPDDPRTLVSPADCRAMFFESIDAATNIWIKGREFTVGRMLGDYYGQQAKDYEGGSLAIFRLAPQDYHRYHSPVDGVMGREEYIPGAFFTVNAMAIRSPLSVYTENVRLVSEIVSPVFGKVMNVWVGAMMVASINQTVHEGDKVQRGDEVGYFAFGGSTIVVVFPPNTVVFDPDLVENSKHAIETLIRVKTRIGRAVDASEQ
ncbi:uncharacterized protein JCM15063_001131 [Sporobolomyces koalae]|uniref:uncharacterized protein n=1 Tax=Sporobolomyces koalae TaxID=500713 RepID=UPI00317BDCB0